jgi:cyclophilin family peptidyl-prolyl cis-trans isomerase/HEAT repeat protein
MRCSRVFVCAVGVLFAASAASPSPPRGQAPSALRHALIALEDSRPQTREEAEGLVAALDAASPAVVRQAVRALGRLERPAFLPDIVRVFAHRDPDVRAEAANAAAQAAPADPATLAALQERLRVERDPAVVGALCDALGRLTFADVETRTGIERALVDVLKTQRPPSPARQGAVLGLESLIRRARGTTFEVRPETRMVLGGIVADTDRVARLHDNDLARRAAMLALNAAGAADDNYRVIAADRDPQVRRLAVAAAMGNVSSALRASLVTAGLTDASPWVRYEALRVHGRHLSAQSCQAELDTARDTNRHVALLAIDLLASACPSNGDVSRVLGALAADSNWLTAAHAVVSLAKRAPDAARPRVTAMATHPTWQARTYAARAAAQLGDEPTLRLLAADPAPGVRATAIEGLKQVAAHRADSTYREALASRDYAVIMAAAQALQGTPDREPAAAALERALARLTADGRDTSRDARMAVLDRLAELGGVAHADALRPYLSDRDPRIAARTASALTAWTGQPHEAVTVRYRGIPVPPASEFDALPPGIRVTMASGGTFEIRFFTNDTPVAVWRIVRLVRQGYYNGLTWHRIVPNFIIQGGSPAADEYVGDGPFMRDELSRRAHTRGTVGISSRGHDTGDAQWFINLVDNPRLDHDYTIVGEVTVGMDVVDAIVEGDTMASVTPLLTPPALKGSQRNPQAGLVLQSGVHVRPTRPLPFWPLRR